MNEQTSIEPLTKSALVQFTGTENWYRTTPLSAKIIYTDGVKYVIEHGEALWLVTDIIAFQHEPKVKNEPFQVWTLEVKDDGSATLTCEDGNGNAIFTNDYTQTDFPLDEITLWLTDDVILLPSEY